MNESDKCSPTINCKGELISLSKPLVMGILNVTPDSFYDGGKYSNGHAVLRQVENMLQSGAAFIDIGAYSSRPGAKHIQEDEEIDRLRVLSEIVREFPQAIISIDTFRSNVAKAALNMGACMVNDISGGELDENMFQMVADAHVPYICMHMKGNPQNMQEKPVYDDVIDEIVLYFSSKLNSLRQMGVNDIIFDPGFGFGKTLEHNYEIVRRLKEIQVLGAPILAGVSRKSMVNKVLNTKALDSLNGTTTLNTICLMQGARILRVHDVKEAIEAVAIYNAYQGEMPNIVG